MYHQASWNTGRSCKNFPNQATDGQPSAVNATIVENESLSSIKRTLAQTNLLPWESYQVELWPPEDPEKKQLGRKTLVAVTLQEYARSPRTLEEIKHSHTSAQCWSKHWLTTTSILLVSVWNQVPGQEA